MNLVKTKGIIVICLNCGKKVNSEKEDIFADIEGEPFKAYYCDNCSKIIRQEAIAQAVLKCPY